MEFKETQEELEALESKVQQEVLAHVDLPETLDSAQMTAIKQWVKPTLFIIAVLKAIRKAHERLNSATN